MEEYQRPMRRDACTGKQAHIVREQVLLGDWDEVQNIPQETLRKWTDEADNLDGLILKGYEMKFGAINENGEVYEKTAFDEFIERYFVKGKLNMPVDINHEGFRDWHAYCGRVLYIEVNSVGFYFVVYVPRSFEGYEQLKWRLQEGIIQGFSKEGYVDIDGYDYVWNEDGTFSHELIHKINVVSVSLVCTPANGVPFEAMKETKNALRFENKTIKASANSMDELFNQI